MQSIGTGTRILHFLVDTALVFLLAYTAYKTWNWYVYYWHYTYFSFFWFFWAVLFVYYFFWEVFANRTPAKRISATKVCTRNGGRPGVGQIF
ncbi:MAG TPA: RDD family protein, partial [Sediminibacterium sp.]|nr:RDD family protein [Sediminibacterium sp.]